MKRLLFSLLANFFLFAFSYAQQSANIVFIGNSITYGALHQQREQTAPPVLCAKWLSQQERIDTVYFRNCGRSGRTTYHFLPNPMDVIPAGDKTYFGDVVAKTRELVNAHPSLPLVFSIMLGTNDAVERTKNPHTEPADYVRNLTVIIDSLLRLWPDAHVVLNRPIYNTSDYVTKNGSVASKKSLKMMNTYYKQLPKVVANCKKGHVHIGDAKAYNYFKQHYLTDIVEEKDARGKSYWLHPNEQGAQKLSEYWGKAILPLLKTVQGQKSVPVILCAGQSNADGRVPLADLPDEFKAYRYCLWSYGSGDFETATGEFSPYSPRVAKPKIEQSWGFDAVVYKHLEQLWQQPFYVIKHTDGGTAIDPACKSSTHGLFWSADPAFLASTTSASHGGKSLLKAFERQIDDCLKNLPKNYDVKCLIWHQGESDQQAADRYYDNLSAVIQHIRQHLANVTGEKKYHQLPVICGTYATGSRQRSQQVVDALMRMEREDKHFHVVDASDLPLLRDRLHFNAEGAQSLGNRVFAKMKEKKIVR